MKSQQRAVKRLKLHLQASKKVNQKSKERKCLKVQAVKAAAVAAAREEEAKINQI